MDAADLKGATDRLIAWFMEQRIQPEEAVAIMFLAIGAQLKQYPESQRRQVAEGLARTLRKAMDLE